MPGDPSERTFITGALPHGEESPVMGTDRCSDMPLAWIYDHSTQLQPSPLKGKYDNKLQKS